MTARRDELAAGLDAVRERIDTACRGAGRSSDEVTLTVVTKFFPASDVRLLAELGVRHVGENRHQEAAGKAGECADLDLVWHFIGGLQSNKAAAIAGYAAVVESVDRPKVLPGLARGAAGREQPLEVLVQVDLDQRRTTEGSAAQDSGRAGAAPRDVPDLARRVADTEGLRLAGVMAVAPLGAEPAPAFALLADVAAQVRMVDPAATWVSAGMSNDLEAAVAAGATHVRIGSAVLGPRPPRR